MQELMDVITTPLGACDAGMIQEQIHSTIGYSVGTPTTTVPARW
jgi:hypothetical protein